MTILPIYELTVYADDDVAELFDVSTDPAHARPYLKAPTSFPEQEVHFAKGSASIGQMNVQVVDVPTVATDQDTGYLTGQLVDPSGYSALLGHRALLTEDLGSGPATILDGVIKSAKLLDTFSSFELELRDIRERERKATAFTNTTTPTVFPRGALLGFGELHPVTIPFFGGTLTFRYPLPPTRPLRATYDLLSATRGQIVINQTQPTGQERSEWTDKVLEVMDHVGPLAAQPEVLVFDRVKVLWRDTAAGGAYTELTQIAHQHPDLPEGGGQILYLRTDVFIRALNVNNEVTADTLPADLQAIDVIVQYDGPPTEDWPHYIIDLTVGELLRNLYRGDFSDEDPRIRYNEAALLLLTTPVGGKIKEPIKDIRAWAEKNAYPIAHAAPVLNAAGEIAPITYILPDVSETLIDLDNNNCRPAGAGWSHSTEDAINIVKVTYRRDYRVDVSTVKAPKVGRRFPDLKVPLLDLLREREVIVEHRTQASIDLLGEQPLEVDSVLLRASGSIDGGPFEGDVRSELGEQVARRIQRMAIDRFALGGQYFKLQGDRGDADVQGLIPGSWVTVSVSWMPDYGVGERNLNRLAQVISRRNVSASWTSLTLLDAGTVNAPLAGPTLGTVTVNAAGVVSIPVTALGAGAECRVDYAQSTLEPAAGAGEWTFLDRVSSVPTTLTTPPVPTGAIVWVRARSENQGRRPSAYTTAVSVTAPATPRLVEVSVGLDEDGIPKVFWTHNATTNGVRIHYQRHLAIVRPTYPDSLDFDADDENATLSELDPVIEGYVFSVQVEPFTGWTPPSVSGTAGPRRDASVDGSLVIGLIRPPPFVDLHWYGSFDEGTGFSLRDRSGFLRDAPPVAGGAALTWVRGVAGMAVDFPGSGAGYEVLSDAQADAIEGLFYASCWIKVDTVAGEAAARIISRGTGEYFDLVLQQNEAFPQDLVFGYSDTQTVTLNDVITTAGVNYFILAQWDQTLNIVELWIGSEATGLLNRVFRSESLAAFSTATRVLGIGSRMTTGASASDPFDGTIDDARVGAPAALLTHEEINSLFRFPGVGSELGGFVPPRIQADFVRVSSTTAGVDLVIEDPSMAVTAIEFNKREGSEASDVFTGWVSTWDRSTGTIGASTSLTRGEDLLVQDGQESILRYRITYTDEEGTSITLSAAFSSSNVDELSTTVFYSYNHATDNISSAGAANYASGYLFPTDTSLHAYLMVAILPAGVTITDYAARMYRNDTGDTATFELRRINNTGGFLTLGTLRTHATTGWATLSDSGPNHVVAAEDQIQGVINLRGVGGGSQARFSHLSITFTRHNYSEEL